MATQQQHPTDQHPAPAPSDSTNYPYAIFWTAWIAALAPLAIWWFCDRHGAILQRVLPGWATWESKGLFVAWAIFWATPLAAVVAATSMLILDRSGVAPEPWRFWSVVGLAVLIESAIALTAFSGDLDHLRRWSASDASVVLSIWLVATILMGTLIRIRPATPITSHLKAAAEN